MIIYILDFRFWHVLFWYFKWPLIKIILHFLPLYLQAVFICHFWLIFIGSWVWVVCWTVVTVDALRGSWSPELLVFTVFLYISLPLSVDMWHYKHARLKTCSVHWQNRSFKEVQQFRTPQDSGVFKKTKMMDNVQNSNHV
jgi:hypothetical protein